MQDQLSTADQLNHGRASKKSVADATLRVGAAMSEQSQEKGLDEKELQRLSTSKAMAALFLKDKVEKLESDVDRLEFKRDSHFSRGARGGRARGSSTTTSRGRGGKNSNSQSQSQSHSESISKGKERQPHQHSSIRLMEKKREDPIDRIISSTESNRDSIKTKTLDIRILDSSVLIYSLRTVHEWLKKDRYVFVVPLEAIVTLDLLKKGDLPINFAARKATRFLEERISRKPLNFKTFDGSISNASTASSSLSAVRELRDSSEKSGNSNSILKSSPGLYAQRESDKFSWDRLKERRQKVLKERKRETEAEVEERRSLEQDGGDVVSLESNREETTVKSFHSEKSHHQHRNLHEESKPPSYIKELLQCCGFHFQLSRKNQIRGHLSEDPQSGIDSGIGEVVVILAYPPPCSEERDQKTVSLSSTQLTQKHAHDHADSRADGIINEKWLKQFGFDILRVETSSSWLGTKSVDHKFAVQPVQPKEKEKEKEEEKGRDDEESKGQVASDFRIW